MKHKTINIDNQDGEVGLEFSNIGLAPDDDKLITTFKNSTSYITVQGDKIQCYNTSDDTFKALDLNPLGGGFKLFGSILTNTGGITIDNIVDANDTLTIKNTNSYVKYNNNNVDCYNTSDDTGQILNINTNADNYVKIFSLLCDNAGETLTSNYRLDVNGNALVREDLIINRNLGLLNTNTVLDRFVNATKSNTSLDVRTDQEAIRLMLGGATDTDTNTYIECNNNTAQTRFFTNTRFDGDCEMYGDTMTIKTTGLDIYRPSGNSSYNLRIRDLQGVFEFRNRTFNCVNASNPALGTLMEIQNTNTAEVRIGSASNARVGIGATPQLGIHLVVGGTSKFGWVVVNQNMTVTNDLFIKTNGRIFQRADANNSMNIISTE